MSPQQINNFKMTDIRSLPPPKSLKQIWTLNKSKKHSKYNRSSNQIWNKNDCFSSNELRTKSPLQNTIQINCLTQISPQLKPLTQPLNQMALNPQIHNPTFLPQISETQSSLSLDQLLKQKLKLLVLINKRRLLNKQFKDNKLISQFHQVNQQISTLMRNIKQQISVNLDDEAQYSEAKMNPFHQLADKTEINCLIKHQNKFNQKQSRNYLVSPKRRLSFSINKIDSKSLFQKQKKVDISCILSLPLNSTSSQICHKKSKTSNYNNNRHKQYQNQRDEGIERFFLCQKQFAHIPRPRVFSEELQQIRREPFFEREQNNLTSLSQSKDQSSAIEQMSKIDIKKLQNYKNKFRNLKTVEEIGRESFSNQAIKKFMRFETSQSCSKSQNHTQNTKFFAQSSNDRSQNNQFNERKMSIIKAKNKKLNSLKVSYKQFKSQI